MEQKNTFSQFFFELCTDTNLRKRFKQDPKALLKERQIDWKDERQIRVIENTPSKQHFVIRQASDLEKLSEKGENIELPEDQLNFLKKITQSSELREQFKQNPKSILKSFNFNIPDTTKIEVLEDTQDMTYWILPDHSEISEEQLANIAGGGPVGSFLKSVYDKVGPLVFPVTFVVSPALLVETIVESIQKK